MVRVKIESSWHDVLKNEFEKPYFEQLTNFVKQEYAHYTCYPDGKNIFQAFELCPFQQVKVVIIGQDPYHEPQQAHGLSFSVQDGIAFPPSLKNIFKEIQNDLGSDFPVSGNLVGQLKGCYCLMLRLLLGRIWQEVINEKGGKYSPIR